MLQILVVLVLTVVIAPITFAEVGDEEIDDQVKAWLENYLQDGETRLFPNDIKGVWKNAISHNLTANWEVLPIVCEGKPSIQTKSRILTPNGGCPDVYTNASVSCTCLEGYNNSTEWNFYIQPRTQLTDQPLTLKYGTTLEINSLVTIVVPDELSSIKIVGVGRDIVTLNTVDVLSGWDEYATDNSPLIEVSTSSTLKRITLENLDLHSVMDTAPDSIENLTFRQTNISQVTTTFLLSFVSLEYLDLSYNQIQNTYLQLLSQMRATNSCLLKSINVSNNALTQLPYRLLELDHLDSLYLENNMIEDWTISTEVYDSISKLTNFNMDLPPDTYACDNGMWMAAQNVKFCVLGNMTTESNSKFSSCNHRFVNYVVIPVCLAVCILLFVFVIHRRGRSQRKDRDAIEIDYTLSFESNSSPNTNLINDPRIIAHRIPFTDIKIVKCINKGGFGLVYSGLYNRHRVAIKRIRTDLCLDMKHIEAFIKEISLMSTLNHPHIVTFIGVAWDTLQNLSAVTEYMELGDLRAVLQNIHRAPSSLTWKKHKLRLVQHIAEALMYLHSLEPKLIHRDLKSKNILLNTKMEAKLSDFGVCRERHLIETHMTAGIGTSFWIAPEVLLGKDYDERADIYSLGIVLSEIDTEDYPYWNAKNPPKGGKAMEIAILRMVAAGELIPEFTESCPQEVLRLAKACLSLNPDDRPSAMEVVYIIQQIMSPYTVKGLGDSSIEWSSSDSSFVSR
ncbi:tkl protein kinase [Plasmopara halstedii]|uniref:Tkl protein kinase n=1 Tax=Plasmopara halstedii TaxID=4781 RepID=A0A0P1AC44_PLAHL|nr:tkl protein kinase [Plasmopara halstedii]CEG37780.1 tkl protein kinase [Plasmopara halstedii]|eukprot:XP_024574149.1 tkl protein kinase [Plasmopara halstedii]